MGRRIRRGFRALKVWLALRQAGAAGYRQMIGDDIALARHLYDLAEADPELEAITHNLSITTFRYVPTGTARQPGIWSRQRLSQRAQPGIAGNSPENSGEAFLSNAVVDGKYALRLCIVNFRSSTADIEALPSLLVRLGRETHTELSSQRTPAADV